MKIVTYMMVVIVTFLMSSCGNMNRDYLDCLESRYYEKNECSLEQGYAAIKTHFEEKIEAMEWAEITDVSGYFYISDTLEEINLTLDSSQHPLTMDTAKNTIELFEEMQNEVLFLNFENLRVYLKVYGHEFDGLYLYTSTEGETITVTINVESSFSEVVASNEEYMLYLFSQQQFNEINLRFISPYIDGGISPDYTQKSIYIASTTENEINSIYFDPIFSSVEKNSIRDILREIFVDYTIYE